ncbi:MAG TPA: hypothetical protein VLF93_02535 [Candidatus Saccharimonadales bacterium]|nr:hypothetical protein [Candidatus Saccharimonadales bacterium]
MRKNFLLFPLVGVLVASTFFIKPTPVQAFSLGDVFNGIKNIFTTSANQHSLTVSSKISLVSSGDLNHNGQIDAGDTVKFSYVITNTTDKSYKFVTLNTNINTKEINGVNEVQGVLSLNDDKDTITIPNLTIIPNQVRTISFDAQINFFKDSNPTIDTKPELDDQNNKSIAVGEAQTINANKMDSETFNKFTHYTK